MKNNKKLNIGIFIDVYYPMIDGVLKVLENHVSNLKELVDFHLIIPSAHRHYVYPIIGEKTLYHTKSMKVFFLDYKLPLPRLDRKLKKHLELLKLDFVIAHSPFGIGEYGLRFAKKHHIPSIIYGHTQLKAEILGITKSRLLTRIIFAKIMNVYRLATTVVAVGTGIGAIFEHEYKLGKAPIVIDNATDLVLLQNKRLAQNIKKWHKLNDELIFSFLGRMHKLKNIYFIADALKIVKNQGIKFKMFFIGDGNHLKRFKKYIEKNGLKEEVIFVGQLKERELIAAYLHISDLFLFPSLNDTNSLVQKEAAAQKTPTLFIEGAMTAHGLVDGVDCFLAPNDVNAYAQKIIELANDLDTLHRIRESVYQNLYRTWDDSVQELYELILHMLEQNQ